MDRATIACLENVKPGASQRILLAADDTPLTRYNSQIPHTSDPT